MTDQTTEQIKLLSPKDRCFSDKHTDHTGNTQEIITTLLKMKAAGLAEETIKQTSYKLRQLAKIADLRNPEEVKTALANMKVSNSTKKTISIIYNYFTTINGLKWTKPKYKQERRLPLIPTTTNIDKIISASTMKYATIFTILKETGLEGHELATTRKTDIDTEQGIVNALGCKKHNSRSIKLLPKTAEMLRTYLAHYTQEPPFPNSKAMGEAWRDTRNKLAKTLQEPQLKQIPLRNLRHYQATMLYDKTKDILLVKAKLGHKRIETTMLYAQLITFNENEEYTVKTATTTQEATDLLEHGFTYIQTIDNIHLYRKRK